ncbi:hypothetical protein SAMN05444397_102396 [Flavobacterium aquidurense]|uniref:Lipoprotein n=1 Tax=Flavobacterium frigidimaris TaxID=262320 RepID=A0ABX4BRC5_FLAFR|nr:hypothetical protein [Flavobacterium frigidimaris]OXA79153.1 hypothetical protein B0A65_11445 [Flavobacterium frigidimaris]SDY84218.1 hypothetical protein SAMN05444397_102396 [Flavobacterium aquidurense]
MKLNFLIISVLFSCNQKSFDAEQLKKYIASKNEFDKNFVNQFPNTLSEYTTYVNNKNTSKNDVGFILYKYKVNPEEFKKVKSLIKKSIGHYKSKDSCLLIVNRFETIETNENRSEVIISNENLINQDCYNSLYPIPNFINYSNPSKNFESYLDGTFDIYVLEAKKGNHFKKFSLMTDLQMPNQWKNGYSKGVAISKEKRTLIYWSIIW